MPSSRWMLPLCGLPHISNFTDFMPLEQHPLLGVRYVQTTRELARRIDRDPARYKKYRGRPAVAAPVRAGSSHLQAGGQRHAGAGGLRRLSDAGPDLADPEGTESGRPQTLRGLGLLPTQTTFTAEKRRTQSHAAVIGGALCRGAPDWVRDPHRAHHCAGRAVLHTGGRHPRRLRAGPGVWHLPARPV